MNNIDFKQPYNRADFLKFVERDFLPDDFRIEVEDMDFSSNYTQQATRLGTCESLGLEVIELTHSSTNDARVGLSKEAFRMLLNRSTHNRALIIFVPQNTPSTYRFSLVTIEVVVDDYKVRRSYSNPRRYSFVLGTEAKVRTPQEYLIRKGKVKDLDDLQKRFSVEVLTKEFYAELSDWYSWAISLVKFPNIQTDATKEQQIEHNSKNVIRLLTRLLFVWFLKQKHLIPNELFDPKYLGGCILNNFDPSYGIGLFEDKGIDSIYYKAILQNLFFATLNCPISSDNKMSRGFRTEGQHFDINSLMRYEKLFKNSQLFLELVNSKVPFLNGGLFDCLDDKPKKIYIDGFSDNLIKPNILRVPDYLFFGEEKGKSIDLTWFYGGDKKKKNVNVRGLVDILNTYNFTIEENTPFDQEVSLDPELLGKVFENLLASYNPETKTTARKQTGSFYTPREIVQYMVDESLIAHLKRTVGEDLESEYRKLMQYTDDELQLTTAQKQEIIRSLNNCKIIDPACGSGAFPVGILQQMVHMLSQLDPDNVYWHQIVKESTLSDMAKAMDIQDSKARAEAITDITKSFDKDVNRPDYARKLYLIENCIYGVDIQSIAVQISKLRFFISLVVEQKATTDANDNFGIRPLPNLEAKFVAANTLIGLEKKDANLFDNSEIAKREEELKQAKHKIYGAKTSTTKQKYKDIVAALRVEIADKLAELGAIGNHTAQDLAKWDMFDQNEYAKFFDPEWMFGVSDGFDIVIGNPPYLKEGRASKTVFDGVRDSPYYQGKMDLWYMFACYGIDLLSTNGALCFIATNNWVTNSGASIMRNKVVDDTKILQLCDFSNFMIFESASIQTMVMLFEKNKSDDNYIIDYRKLRGETKLSDVVALLSKTNTPKVEYLNPVFNRDNYKNKYIIFSSDEAILDKISNAENVIYLTNKEVANGIHPHYDFVNNKIAINNKFNVGDGIFGLSDFEKNELNLMPNEDDLIKPYYNNANLVNRYYTNPANKYWIIYTDSSFKEPNRMNSYPNLKAHLDKFADIITSDNKPYGLHRAREERFFKGEKVIALRKCVGRPLFSYSDFDCYLSATFYIIKTNRVNMKYLTGLLNSKLVKFWLKNRGKMQGDNYQLDKEPLVAIPIAKPSNEIQQKIATLVDYIIWLKTNLSEPINDYVDNEYVAQIIEDIIDALVYELYFSLEFSSSNITINSMVNPLNNVSDFYKSLKSDESLILNQIKIMKVELRNLLMPILSV